MKLVSVQKSLKLHNLKRCGNILNQNSGRVITEGRYFKHVLGLSNYNVCFKGDNPGAEHFVANHDGSENFVFKMNF